MEELFQKADIDLREIHFELKNLETARNESESQPLFQSIHQKTM